MIAMPFTDIDSMCSMPLTVEVSQRSTTVVIRFSMLPGDMPVYVQHWLTIGTSIAGKMSTAISVIAMMPKIAMDSAITINVWGRFSANSTIHILRDMLLAVGQSRRMF